MSKQLASLNEFITEYGTTKAFLAEKLDVSRPTLDALLLEGDRKPPQAVFDVRSELAARIGELIGRDAEYVRDYYTKAVAA